jgi:hypothetical protein
MPGVSGAKSPDVRAPERLYFTERGRVTLNPEKSALRSRLSSQLSPAGMRDELRPAKKCSAAKRILHGGLFNVQ